jgi:hypothetical protein
MQQRCKHAFLTIERIFSACSCKVVTKKSSGENRVEFRDTSLPGYELGSRGIELSWQLRNDGKKGIRLLKDDFMCDLK